MENIIKEKTKRKRKQFLPSILNLLNFKQMVTSDSNKEEISEPRVFNMHLFQVFKSGLVVIFASHVVAANESAI